MRSNKGRAAFFLYFRCLHRSLQDEDVFSSLYDLSGRLWIGIIFMLCVSYFFDVYMEVYMAGMCLHDVDVFGYRYDPVMKIICYVMCT
jgi:hypothetical protein